METQMSHLTHNVLLNVAVLIPHDWVEDHTVVARGDGYHPPRPTHHHLVVLPDEGGGPHLQPGHVGGLVQDMDVVVGRDPEHGQFLLGSHGDLVVSCV